jgi:hypothetical protein
MFFNLLQISINKLKNSKKMLENLSIIDEFIDFQE